MSVQVVHDSGVTAEQILKCIDGISQTPPEEYFTLCCPSANRRDATDQYAYLMQLLPRWRTELTQDHARASINECMRQDVTLSLAILTIVQSLQADLSERVWKKMEEEYALQFDTQSDALTTTEISAMETDLEQQTRIDLAAQLSSYWAPWYNASSHAR